MAQQKRKAEPRTRANPEKEFVNRQFKPFTAKNHQQKKLFQAAKDFSIVFATGCAGVGKTAVLTSYAAEQLGKGLIDKIVITRPSQEAAGESLGFLPGDINLKYEWVVAPVKSILEEVLGKSTVEMFLKDGKIEGIPLGYMRGRTIKNAIVIADEMQNSNPAQAEMLMTRIGENCKLFITGDLEQSDLRGINGLEVAVKYASWMPYAKVVEFGLDDIVRSYMTSDIIQSFRKFRQENL